MAGEQYQDARRGACGVEPVGDDLLRTPRLAGRAGSAAGVCVACTRRIRRCRQNGEPRLEAVIEHGDRGLVRVEQRQGLVRSVGMDSPRESGQVLPAVDDRQHHQRREAQCRRIAAVNAAEAPLELAGALFVANDPAGEILFARGWSFDDLVYGVGSRLRESDAYAESIGVAPPRRYDPFLEIDNRIGYYADLTWRSAALGRVTLLYYDNRADPSAYHTFNQGDELFAWRTHFSSAGAQTQLGQVTLIGQAMAGTTEIAPTGFRGEAHFASAYVLAGWNLGTWRPALRVDTFSTREDPAFPPALSEHGNAVTVALNWRPLDWLRLTGEALRVDSVRDQRLALGLAPRQIDTQLQFNARILF